MFGKGVYFADMASKSGKLVIFSSIFFLINNLANYCFAKRESPEGLMLLCEVALGKVHECLHATTLSADTLPKGTQSTKGCGQTIPDPKGLTNL